MSAAHPSTALVCCLALVLGSASPVLAQDDPIDPNVPGAPLVYEPVMGFYEAVAPVTKPGNWKELNDLAEKLGGQRGQLQPSAKPVQPNGSRP